jgi:Rrf2 family protein
MLRISEAAGLALHATALLANESEVPRSTGELARTLAVSEAHLSKVLQRLARHGLVRSTRGPRGGWTLTADASEVTLRRIWEAIEGPLAPSSCLLESRECPGKGCLLGGLLELVNRQVLDYLSSTKLSSFACAYVPTGAVAG